MRRKKLVVSLLMIGIFAVIPVIRTEAATFSEYWFQDSDGSWKVKDNNGNITKNAWLCDDAVAENGQDVWYLLDENGNMISSGLVQDQTGNYYSLETEHNGYYGMLRYKSGNYSGINLNLEGNHSGAFAAILNGEGIEALKTKYGVTNVSISNANCVYTSSFKGSGGSSTQNNNNTQPQQSQAQSNTNKSTGYAAADRWANAGSCTVSTENIHEVTGDIRVGDCSGYTRMH